MPNPGSIRPVGIMVDGREVGAEGVPVPIGNVETTRDACELYPNPAVWGVTTLTGNDLIVTRGNTAGAGWIELSKDPFAADNTILLPYAPTISLPARVAAFVSLTHRNAGEHVAAIELVSDDAAYGGAPVPSPEPVAILNASQSTTTITINFSSPLPVPFRIGQVVSIYGFVDTRLNVNSAVVASTPSPTQITIVGNDYTFTSTTIGTVTPPADTAFIERADQLGGARNGVAVVHGNATVTNRRYYARSQASLAFPSGTLAGSHHVTSGTDTSTAATSAPYSEAWRAPLETVILASAEGVTVADRGLGAGSALTSRFRSGEVIPNPARPYKLRFRVRSTPSLTRPLAAVVSATKSGSSTMTVVTATPHGLTTGQYVGVHGVRDQTNFANAATGGAACTVVNDTTFTVAQGASATATSYGGFVYRVQGQQSLGGLVAQVAQSVTRTGNIVTVTATAAVGTTAIGNLVNLIGFRADGTGADLGLDGVYVVRDLTGSTGVLEPLAGVGPTGPDIASINCGGAIIQRFGMRIHGVGSAEYDPVYVEPAAKGLADAAEQLAVVLPGGATINASTNLVGDVGVQYRATGTGGGTPVNVNSPATPVAQSVKASAGKITSYDLTNHNSTLSRYIKVFNTASAVTMGTTSAAYEIALPPNSTKAFTPAGGLNASAGIQIAVTGGRGPTDNTAITAGDVTGHIDFA